LVLPFPARKSHTIKLPSPPFPPVRAPPPGGGPNPKPWCSDSFSPTRPSNNFFPVFPCPPLWTLLVLVSPRSKKKFPLNYGSFIIPPILVFSLLVPQTHAHNSQGCNTDPTFPPHPSTQWPSFSPLVRTKGFCPIFGKPPNFQSLAASPPPNPTPPPRGLSSPLPSVHTGDEHGSKILVSPC